MTSASESGTVAVLLLTLLSISVLLLLNHFLPLRTSPAFVTIPIFLALVLPISAILLVPLDLASSLRAEDESSRGVWLPNRMVLVAWRISYWLTFLLTWLILPFLGEYMDSGFQSPKQKMIYSLRSNGRYYLIVLVCSAAGLLYIGTNQGFNFIAIKGLVMALAYVWGLILAIYLMGHGLVVIPRRIWRDANLSAKLRRIQSRAARVHEKRTDATVALEEVEAQVAALRRHKDSTAPYRREWIAELVAMAGSIDVRARTSSSFNESAAAEVSSVVTDRYLADLTRRLDRARRRCDRHAQEWNHLVYQATRVQTILNSRTSQRLSFASTSSKSSILTKYSPLTPYLRYHLHIHVIRSLRSVGAVFLALASLCVVWSELVKFPFPQASAISLTVIHQPNSDPHQVGPGAQLTAAAWILYMCACALVSVNDVPVWNERALIKGHTSAESACWYASQIAKLTVPLSYNFLTMLPVDVHELTTFYHFLGRLINLTPLGTGFDYFFPVFILVPVCATAFNLYTRIQNICSFGMMDDEDGDDDGDSSSGMGRWREGRDLIAQDLAGPRGQASTSLNLLRNDAQLPSTNRKSNNNNNNTGRQSSPSRPHSHPPSFSSYSLQREHRGPNRTRLNHDPELADDDDDDDDDTANSGNNENFFTLFGKRVKNTIDTIDPPRWMQQQQQQQPSSSSSSLPFLSTLSPRTVDESESSDSLFKTPRWMSGGNGDDGNTSVSTSLRRIFGGTGR